MTAKQAVRMPGLPVCPVIRGDGEGKMVALHARDVREIRCFVLPEGTQVAIAVQQWAEKMGIPQKTSFKHHGTVEEGVEAALACDSPGCLPIFWTYAAYPGLPDLCQKHPEARIFHWVFRMELEEVVLATRPELAKEINGSIPVGWLVAYENFSRHLATQVSKRTELTDNNAEAARLVAAKMCNACITTVSAQRQQGLTVLHQFGSPGEMVFFGGVGPNGIELMKAK